MPILAQVLARSKDLLDDQVDWSRRSFAQAPAVGLGIQQPIDVVDAQPIQHAIADQLEGQAMGMVEQFLMLDAQSGKIADVEEAAVIDVVGCHAEIGHAPILVGNQPVEPAPTLQLPGNAGEMPQTLGDGPRRCGISRNQGSEIGLELPGPARFMRMEPFQMGEGIAQFLELGVIAAKDAAVMSRIDGKLVGAMSPDGDLPGGGVQA